MYWLRIFWLAARRFYFNNYTYQASALAFVTVTSLIPILSILVYLATFMVDLGGLLLVVNRYLYDNFLPGPIATIQQYIIKFTSQASQLPVFSIVFSLITGIILILTVETCLNQIWHIKSRPKKLIARIAGWIALLVLPFFIAFSVALSQYFSSLVSFDILKRFLIFLFSIITNATIFAVLYLAIPNTHIRVTNAFSCSLITALLFEIIKYIFVFYITYFTSYAFIYGALASIPIFLVWIYVVWCLFLYGALLISVKQELAWHV